MPAFEPPRESHCCNATPLLAAAPSSRPPPPPLPTPPSISPNTGSSSSSSSTSHPVLLSPRGICRTWKEMKSRALIHTGVSLTFLEMVATSPVASLLPSLPPYSPRSPSSLLLHKRFVQQQQQQQISPKLHRAMAKASSDSSSTAAASPSSTPSQIDASSPSHHIYTDPAVRIITKSIRSMESNNSVRRRLTPSEALFICVAWMMWLWGRFVCRLYSLLMWWRMHSPHFFFSKNASVSGSSTSSTSASFMHKAKQKGTVMMDEKASGAMTRSRRNALHDGGSSSRSRRVGAAKLRSSFKTSLSVQIPRSSSRSHCNSNNHHPFCTISPSPLPHSACISPLSRTAVSSPLSISSSHNPLLFRANSSCSSGISATSSSTSPPSPSGSSTPATPAQSVFIICCDQEKPSPPPSRDLVLHYLAAPIALLLGLAGLLFGKVIATGIVVCWLLLLRLLWMMLYRCFKTNGSSRPTAARRPQTHPSIH